jgi:hypothetical protein
MKTYTDKNGTVIKAGDICYYSELPYSNYADSLCEIIELGGRLHSKTHVVNYLGTYKNHNDEDPIDLKFSLPHFEIDRDNGGECKEYLILSGLDLENYDLVDYMNQNFNLQKAG